MKYLLQRFSFYIFTLWAAITINFFIPRLTPGNPVQAVMASFGGQLDPHAIQSLTVLFGLDKHQSLWQQYISYWGQLAHGDLGISFHNFPTPVSSVLRQELPWTLALLGVTTLIAFTLGTLLGVLAGWRRGGWSDNLIPATTFLQSVPYFFLALLAINFLANGPNALFPSSGGYDVGMQPGLNFGFIGNAIHHSLLPALTILVTSIAGWILGMRNMMVTTTAEDYITVAHAKGLSEGRVAFGYAARNALLPSVSGFGMALGLVVSGAFLVENVFSYPGIGEELVTSIGQKDYPMLQGIFLVVTITVLVANLIADVVYTLLDPRTRKEG